MNNMHYELIDCNEKIRDAGYRGREHQFDTDHDEFYSVVKDRKKYTLKIYNRSLDAIYGKKYAKEKARLKIKEFPFPSIFDRWECKGNDGSINDVIIMDYILCTLDDWLSNKDYSFSRKIAMFVEALYLLVRIHQCGHHFLVDRTLLTDIVIADHMNTPTPFYVNVKKLEKLNTVRKDFGDDYIYMPMYTLLPQFLKLITSLYFPENKFLSSFAQEIIPIYEATYFEKREKAPIAFIQSTWDEYNMFLFIKNKLVDEKFIMDKEKYAETELELAEEMSDFDLWLREKEEEKQLEKNERRKWELEEMKRLSELYDRGEILIE